MGDDTYYDILGVPPTATQDEIKARYRDLIRRIHPDTDGPAALFRQVQQAYEVLSVPARRAAYDRSPGSRGAAERTQARDRNGDWSQASAYGAGSPRGHAGPRPSADRPASGGRSARASALRHPAGAVAIAGAALIVAGAVLSGIGTTLVALGLGVLLVASVAGLGGRGEKERAAYQRSGMTAVDAMTGRQFEALLQHLFAHKGYRVARIGGRGEFGVDLLLNDADGRMIVQARRWTRVVPHDLVQLAVAAKVHYGADRALVVTSSEYPQDAVAAANSNGVVVWNRSTLATELTVFRGDVHQSALARFSSELRAGSRLCLGFVVAVFVALVVANARRRGPVRAKRRHG